MSQTRNQRIQPTTTKPSRGGRNQRLTAKPKPIPKDSPPKKNSGEKEVQDEVAPKKKGGWSAGLNPLASTTPASSPTTETTSTSSTTTTPTLQPVYMEHAAKKKMIILGPGMVLLKDRMSLSTQREIVDNCIAFGDGKVPEVGGFFDGKLTTDKGFYDVELPSPTEEGEEDEGAGRKKLNMISKARVTVPIEHYPKKFTDLALQYLKEAQDFIADHLEEGERLRQEADDEEGGVIGLDDSRPSTKNTKKNSAEDVLPAMDPKFLLLNYYARKGKIGWHYDRVPSLPPNLQYTVRSPIISMSVGDSAEFIYKWQWNDETRSVLLESGDVLIFGGDSRMIYHMVPSINLGTTPKGLNLRHFPGRFNITIRQD